MRIRQDPQRWAIRKAKNKINEKNYRERLKIQGKPSKKQAWAEKVKADPARYEHLREASRKASAKYYEAIKQDPTRLAARKAYAYSYNKSYRLRKKNEKALGQSARPSDEQDGGTEGRNRVDGMLESSTLLGQAALPRDLDYSIGGPSEHA